mgnify:CR=1 FL=1
MSVGLVALDWGISHLHAWRMDGDGAVLDQRASDDGASRLAGGTEAFEAALRRLAGDWLQPGTPVVACGMVGSAHGWREAPYVACPVGLGELHRHVVTVRGRDGLSVHIVPGLKTRDADGLPDVMRGEETQLAGLLVHAPEMAAQRLTVVMPGTHSKWVRLHRARVEGFATRMTGELFGLLREHSVLARLMSPATRFDEAAFDRGVQQARRAAGADLAHSLFGVRALGLFGELGGEAAADYLSGLLIGSEVAGALAGPSAADAGELILIGEAELCTRYGRALGAWGRAAIVFGGGLAALGLHQLMRAAGRA